MLLVGDNMVVPYSTKDLDLLARLMRAEAVGEGDLGMLMVGNVGVNRVVTECYTFKDIRTISQMIYQNPGGFAGVYSPQFNSSSTIHERELAQNVLRGEYYYPATNALWFYAPASGSSCVDKWYDQSFVGNYKNHCFYQPDPGVCPPIN